MTGRERVKAALAFRPVDKAPLEYHPCGRGLYEHGEALRGLIKALPGDFEDFSDAPIPKPSPDAVDADGRYHEFQTDGWGVTWEMRIFSMMGHPFRQPLADWAALDSFRCPPHPLAESGAMERYARHVAEEQEKGHYVKGGGIGFFERMHALRPFEDVLMDIYDNGREINRLADMLMEYEMEELRLACEAGVDGIQFGDDFGTTRAMLMSPEIWRSFFKPRYRRLVRFAKDQGKDVFFHTCGYTEPILPDLREIGVDSMWPQLTAYESADALAKRLRELHLACAIHIDRAGIMTRGRPEDVTRAVHEAARAFDIWNGGAFFYVETDNDFPFENIRALLDAIGTYRKGE